MCFVLTLSDQYILSYFKGLLGASNEISAETNLIRLKTNKKYGPILKVLSSPVITINGMI